MNINTDGVKFNSNIISTDLANIKANDWFGKLNLNAVTDLEREYVDKLLTAISLNNVQDSVTFTDTRLVYVATKILINHSMSEVLLSEYGMDEYLIYFAYLVSFYDNKVDGMEEVRLFVTYMIGSLNNGEGLSVEEKKKLVSLSNSLLDKIDSEDLYKRTPDFVITAIQMASKMEVGEIVTPIENADIKDADLEDREPEVKGESTAGSEVESQIQELQDAIQTFRFLIISGASEEEVKELEDAIVTFEFLIETLGVSEEEDSPKKEEVEEEKDLRDQLKQLGLTQMEQVVTEALIKSLYAEPGFSDVDANDLVDSTNITRKQIRGVLASLTKKGLIGIDTSKDSDYNIIYLNEDYYYLHPEWKDQVDNYAKGGKVANYKNFEMVVISKELNKDGGRNFKDRMLVSARNIKEARKIATKLWKERINDESDLMMLEVLTDSELRQSKKYNEGGEMSKGEVTFIEYKENEIMYEPNYNKYYANDVEFDSLEQAQKFLDSGKMSSDVRSAYERGLFATGGRSRTGNYTITDDTGDAVVENADEEAVILFANTMFYYDAMDSGEEEIATLDEAISALKTMDYSVNTNKKK